jgi:HEAT repeat protein
LSENMISNLAGSLGGLKDPISIPTLSRLLTLRDQRITPAIAMALRQTRSPDALKPLSTLLTNDELTVRYYAVVGMGEITAQDPWTPTFDEFRDHESKYLSYWHEWAASNLPKDHPK